MNILLIGLAAMCLLQGLAGKKDQQNWSTIIHQDLSEAHDIIEKLPFKEKQWLLHGVLQSRNLAKKADSIYGYEFALRYFVNGFHNRNILFGIANHERMISWPGFLVAYENGELIVVAVDAEKQQRDLVPPLGARILLCNGQHPEEFLQNNILPYLGNAEKEVDRRAFFPYLFLDIQNPYAQKAEDCCVEVAGKEKRYQLTWQKMTDPCSLDVHNALAHQLYQRAHQELSKDIYALAKAYPEYWMNLENPQIKIPKTVILPSKIGHLNLPRSTSA